MAHTNVWGSKFDLAVKRSNVKRQHRTIILAILVDLLFPIICAKISAQGLFDSGKRFLKVYTIMGMADILINGPYPFKPSFVLLPQGGST